MKHVKVILIFISSIILSGCISTTDPTSPPDQNLTLNKEFDTVTINLRYGEKVNINNEFSIKFEGVISDSRCPVDVICVWAGNGEIKLTLSSSNQTKSVKLNTLLEPLSVTFGSFVIELKNLNPVPRSDREIKMSDYNIDLIIKPADNSTVGKKNIKLIDNPDDSQIKHDMLNVNAVNINQDILSFEVGYSGGCREHEIELFALKGIAKSNPAQVTVLLSHNADGDMCEAYITKKITFDLTVLKNYLKSNHNINDKVLLVIHDPSGRPIRNPVVEYKF